MRTSRWHIGVLGAALAFGTPALAQSGGASGGSAATSGGTGVTGSSGSGSGGTGMSGSASAKSGKALDKGLQEAAQKLHAANLGEVQAGQAAQSSAQSPEVKQFAQRMIDDHQKNDDRLQQLSQTIGVSLQGDAFTKKQKDAQKDLQKVQGKSGADFDKAYMKMMVDDHKKDVKEVDKAAKDARKKNQTELASFLEETHSQLQMHLQEAQRVEKSLSGKGARSSTGASGAGSSASGPSTSGTTAGGSSGR